MSINLESHLERVVIHPLVLLSVVDHFNRIVKISNQKRIIGVLLGSLRKNILDVTNSFAEKITQYGFETMILVIIVAKPKDLGLPTEAYVMVEEIHNDGTPTTKTFEHVPSEISTEEVGVEYLLRDIKETTLGMNGLEEKLKTISYYIKQVSEGNGKSSDIGLPEFVKSNVVKTNDQLFIYLASMIRSILALNNLINNQITNRDEEKKEFKKDENKDAKIPIKSEDAKLEIIDKETKNFPK
ncbi:unnamed protein product [Gordionus sp. m RMFG-2023]